MSEERKSHHCGCGHKHTSSDGLQCAGTDAVRQMIVKEADAGHWGLVGILQDDKHPYHTFTVGLYENFDHPELLIFGLHPYVAGNILNEIGERIAKGLKLETGQVYMDDLVPRYGVVFIPVEKEKYDAYLGTGLWYYQGDHFPVLQMVWPDKNGKFPWEEGFDMRYAAVQPLLGYVPANAGELHGLPTPPDASDQ